MMEPKFILYKFLFMCLSYSWIIFTFPHSLAGLPWSLSWWRIHLQCRRPQFDSWVGKICWRRDRLPSPVLGGFPCGSAGKESAGNVGDMGSIPGLGRSPGEGKGYPLQYSGLGSSMGLKESDMTEWISCVYLTAELYPPTPQVSTQVLHFIQQIKYLLN